MVVTQRGFLTWAVGGAFMLPLAMILGAHAADDKTYLMKIALATLDDALHQYAKNYAAAVEKDSDGRVKAEIYPTSKMGSIARQAEGVQLGAIQAEHKAARTNSISCCCTAYSGGPILLSGLARSSLLVVVCNVQRGTHLNSS